MGLREYLWRRWTLGGVDECGVGVKVLGRPRIDNQGFMHLGDGVTLNARVVPIELCTALQSTLHIGDGCELDYGVSIGVAEHIHIGNRVRVGAYCMIIDTDFHDLYNRALRPPPSPVRIGDGVWIGAKSSILRGVTIGEGAVIGVGSVVNRDVAAYAHVAGVPAREVAV